jgi:hypothetical protein
LQAKRKPSNGITDGIKKTLVEIFRR